MTPEASPDTSTPSSTRGGARAAGKGRTALALSLGLLVVPVQAVLVLGWSAVTDLTLVEALARSLGMTTSGLGGYFFLVALGVVLFAALSLAATFALALALLRSGRLALVSLGSAAAIVLVTGFVVAGNRSSLTDTLHRQTEELEHRANERVETLASRTRLENLRVEPGPLYESMGATAENPCPEWGELLWSVRVAGDLIVPVAGPYELTVEYRLRSDEEPHARLEAELTLEEGRNTLDVTLDANDSRDYQGFWDPARSEGSVVLVLRREISPAELYGEGLDAVTRSTEGLFGPTAEDLQPTSRSVELLRERIEL